MATPNKTTYEELINNDDFVGDAGLALRALGEKVVFKNNSREERKAVLYDGTRPQILRRGSQKGGSIHR